MLPITIRQPLPSDRALILDTWQKSFLGVSRARPQGEGPLSHMRRSDYYREQERVIDAIFRHPETELLVAHHADGDPDLFIGWVCGVPARRILHFLYVSGNWRREHVGTRLMRACFIENIEGPSSLPGAPLDATHWTWRLPCYREKWRLRYNPYRLREVLHG